MRNAKRAGLAPYEAFDQCVLETESLCGVQPMPDLFLEVGLKVARKSVADERRLHSSATPRWAETEGEDPRDRHRSRRLDALTGPTCIHRFVQPGAVNADAARRRGSEPGLDPRRHLLG